jgi:hypothetical protein
MLASIRLIGGEVDAVWRPVGESSHRAAMVEESGPCGLTERKKGGGRLGVPRG